MNLETITFDAFKAWRHINKDNINSVNDFTTEGLASAIVEEVLTSLLRLIRKNDYSLLLPHLCLNFNTTFNMNVYDDVTALVESKLSAKGFSTVCNGHFVVLNIKNA